MKNGWIQSISHVYNTTEAEAIALEAGDLYSTEKYYVKGTVTEVYNTTYGNMYITDGMTYYYCKNDGLIYIEDDDVMKLYQEDYTLSSPVVKIIKSGGETIEVECGSQEVSVNSFTTNDSLKL